MNFFIFILNLYLEKYRPESKSHIYKSMSITMSVIFVRDFYFKCCRQKPEILFLFQMFQIFCYEDNCLEVMIAKNVIAPTPNQSYKHQLYTDYYSQLRYIYPLIVEIHVAGLTSRPFLNTTFFEQQSSFYRTQPRNVFVGNTGIEKTYYFQALNI